MAIDLFWLPLGAGGHSVRLNGRVYEALAARAQRRPAYDLYHSALEVRLPEGVRAIEMAPIRDRHGKQRGVAVEGPVGARWAGRWRLFRYEVRRWQGGHIPDVAEAVDSPRRVSDDDDQARRLLTLVPRVPTLTWGRDELGTGDMWNSNSVTSWLLDAGVHLEDGLQGDHREQRQLEHQQWDREPVALRIAVGDEQSGHEHSGDDYS